MSKQQITQSHTYDLALVWQQNQLQPKRKPFSVLSAIDQVNQAIFELFDNCGIDAEVTHVQHFAEYVAFGCDLDIDSYSDAGSQAVQYVQRELAELLGKSVSIGCQHSEVTVWVAR